MSLEKRTLGQQGLEVSAIGLCNIGWSNRRQAGQWMKPINRIPCLGMFPTARLASRGLTTLRQATILVNE
jgi:hypothetical protein